MCDEPCAETSDFTIEERKKAYLMAIMETNDIRLKLRHIYRLIPYVTKYKLYKEFFYWMPNRILKNFILIFSLAHQGARIYKERGRRELLKRLIAIGREKMIGKRYLFGRRSSGTFPKEVEKLLSKLKKTSKEKGIYYVINSIIKMSLNWLKISFWYYYYKIFKSRETFTFEGETYNYFYHQYNTTWRNERAVEIPIILKIVKEHYNQQKRILEIGNVLSHYSTVNHTIVDKYEKARGVINEDVINFQSPEKYDLIVSISTLEHLDYDENPSEPIWKNLDKPIKYKSIKVLRAIQNLKKLLVPEGKMIIIMPLGYNLIVDQLLIEDKIQFTRQYYLKRSPRANKWEQASKDECQRIKYDFIRHSAQAIIIGIYYDDTRL